MTTTAITPPLTFAGAPASAWAFGIRIWIAVVVALAASFWLELEVPSSAAVTVAILATPTRGPALEKAYYRLIATFIGVAATIVITGLFSQTRDLLLVAFAGWIGLCVYAAGLLDGNRAYAAVLSGYTVALVAIQQIDTPGHVFETGVARGAAIVVGIAAIAIVNDLLVAPDSFPQLGAKLLALHRRVRDYAKPGLASPSADVAIRLLRDITALRPEIASLGAESSSGAARSAAARNTVVALVAEVHAARGLNTTDATGSPWAMRELLRRDAEVQDGLNALKAGVQPLRVRRTPFYRSHPIAAAAGLRAAAWLALPAVIFVMAGWPATAVSLSLVAVLIGLGATAPDQKGFTTLALIASPIALVLAGTLEFLILDGVNEFALLTIALAPFMIGGTVLMVSPNRLLSGLGRLNLIFILVILGPSNPPSYDPQAFLFISLFLCVGTALLLIAQVLIPTLSTACRLRWITASARHDFESLLSCRDRRLTPEEAMFRDATRIAQIPAGGTDPEERAVLEETLSYFDRSAAIRRCRADWAQLLDSSLSPLVAEAEMAFVTQDARRLSDVARQFEHAGGAEAKLAEEIGAELLIATTAIHAAALHKEPES